MKLFKIIVQHVNHKSRVQTRFSGPFLEKPHSAVDSCVPVLTFSRVCVCVCVCVRALGRSVMAHPLQPYGLQPARLLSMGFSKQKYWNGLSFPSPGDPPNSVIEPASLTLAGRFVTTEPPRKPSSSNRQYLRYYLALKFCNSMGFIGTFVKSCQ